MYNLNNKLQDVYIIIEEDDNTERQRVEKN